MVQVKLSVRVERQGPPASRYSIMKKRSKMDARFVDLARFMDIARPHG